MAAAGGHGPEGQSFPYPRQLRLAIGVADAAESRAVTLYWLSRGAGRQGTMRETARYP